MRHEEEDFTKIHEILFDRIKHDDKPIDIDAVSNSVAQWIEDCTPALPSVIINRMRAFQDERMQRTALTVELPEVAIPNPRQFDVIGKISFPSTNEYLFLGSGLAGSPYCKNEKDPFEDE